LQLVEKAVARGEQKLDLVLLGEVGLRVIDLGHGAQRGFLGAAGPAKDGDFGLGEAGKQG
jgi:hypothetical protein